MVICVHARSKPKGLWYPCLENTCSNSTLTATPDSSSLEVIGGLETDQEYCEVTLNVTANTPGTFTNGTVNLATTGLIPPEQSSSVTVGSTTALADTGANQRLLIPLAVVLVTGPTVFILRHRILSLLKGKVH